MTTLTRSAELKFEVFLLTPNLKNDNLGSRGGSILKRATLPIAQRQTADGPPNPKKPRPNSKTLKGKENPTPGSLVTKGKGPGSTPVMEAESSEDDDPDSNWNVLLPYWPLHSREANLRKKSVINAMNINHCFKLVDYAREDAKNKKSEALLTCKNDDKLSTLRFSEAKDDRRKRIHPASLLRMPVTEPSTWYSMVPVKRDEIYRNIPLKPTGSAHTVCAKSVELLHNRTSYITLKMFLTENLNVGTKAMKELRRLEDDGMTTTLELDWVSATTINQIQEAVVNFGVVLQALWPLDTTAWAFIRLMTKYKWIAGVDVMTTRTKIITSVFNRIVQENASTAANEGHPMYFSEMEDLLKDSLARNGHRSDVPVTDRRQEGSRQQTGRYQQTSSQQFGSRPSSTPTQRRPPASLNGKRLCYGYNDENGRTCTYTPVGQDKNGKGGGCMNAQNVEFSHACSKWLANRNKYCLGSHRRADHK